jgi:hypothetical protein
MNADGDNVKMNPKEMNHVSLEERRNSHKSYRS